MFWSLLCDLKSLLYHSMRTSYYVWLLIVFWGKHLFITRHIKLKNLSNTVDLKRLSNHNVHLVNPCYENTLMIQSTMLELGSEVFRSMSP